MPAPRVDTLLGKPTYEGSPPAAHSHAASGEHAPAGTPPTRTREEMRSLYDAYFTSRDYDLRYPQPNIATMDFLRAHGAMHCERVLDFGCGNGRYAIPFLLESEACLTGCDISAGAIASFARRLVGSPLARRIELVTGGLEKIHGGQPFDAMFLLFGVLSHVGSRADRHAVLRHLREMAAADCRLFLSVPSIWRRRPFELIRSLLRTDREALGDIRFSRRIAGQRRSFHYHLYSLSGLRAELADAGWTMTAREAESILPEYLVTGSGMIGRLDHLLQPLVPAALGYGIRVLARPDGGRT